MFLAAVLLGFMGQEPFGLKTNFLCSRSAFEIEGGWLCMWEPQALFALALSTLAGLSTLLGALVILIGKGKSEKLLTSSLGFAAGVMLSISFSDLLPQARDLIGLEKGMEMGIIYMDLFLIAGVFLAIGLDYLVPHVEANASADRSHQDLFRVGVVSTLAMMLHNFPEGIATFMAGYSDQALGMSLAVAIAFHNIPEGISVAMPVYFATGDKSKALKFTFAAGIAEPIGALAAFLVMRPFLNQFVIGASFAFVAGIMLYISIEELIPSSRQYGHNRLALFSTLAGCVLMPLSHLF